MALVKCSGCRRKVSDKAATCPNCGAPLTLVPDSVRRATRAGGKWQGIGFALIVVGIVIGVVSNRALGSVVALAGVALFIISRKK